MDGERHRPIVSSNTFVNQHTFCIDCTLSLSCANDVNPMTLELEGVVAESAISVCLGKELKHIPTSTLWFGWLDCVVPIRVWAVFSSLSGYTYNEFNYFYGQFLPRQLLDCAPEVPTYFIIKEQ